MKLPMLQGGRELVLIVLCAGCVSGDPGRTGEDPVPQFPLREGGASHPEASPGTPGPPADTQVTLARALQAAQSSNPALKAFSQEIRVREGYAIQAGLPPNPELRMGVEGFGLHRGAGAFRNTETSLSLGQVIQLGGKRGKAEQAALRKQDLAQWDYRTRRLEVLTETTQAFVDVLAAQENLVLITNALELAHRVADSVAAQVEAGKLSPVASLRAQVAVSQNRAARERAANRLDNARARLAAQWGATEARFERAVGDLRNIVPVPSIADLSPWMQDHPGLARWRDERAEREARLRLERARAFPDVMVRAGPQRFEGSDAVGLMGVLSVPLPVRDRNQGNIRAAEADLKKAGHERQEAEVRLYSQLAVAQQTLASAYREAVVLREEVVGGARDAFLAVRTAYEGGKLELIDVLDAQRILFEAERDLVNTLARYQQAKARLEGLIGRPIPRGESGG